MKKSTEAPLFITIFLYGLTLFPRMLCIVSSFHYDSYRRLSWGYNKAIVTARGIAVLIPSIAVFATLSMWGPAIFGSVGETLVFIALVPIVIFTLDYILIAYSYSDMDIPEILKWIRVLMLLLSISINLFVVAGSNPESLLKEIETEVRASQEFKSRIDDLEYRTSANLEDMKQLRIKIAEGDAAKKEKLKFEKYRDAEIGGRTLADGKKRDEGDGDIAKGFGLEIVEKNQIMEIGEAAKQEYVRALKDSKYLKSEKEKLEDDIKANITKHQTPGTMVMILFRQIKQGNIDIMLSTLLLVFMLTVIDLSALIMSHLKTPHVLISIVKHRTAIDVARCDLDKDIELKEINALRPTLDIKIGSNRPSNLSTKIFNMTNESPDHGERHSNRRVS